MQRDGNGSCHDQTQLRTSYATLLDEARQLERGARLGMQRAADALEQQLQGAIATYRQTCGDIPRLQIESEIATAKSLIAELRMLAQTRRL